MPRDSQRPKSSKKAAIFESDKAKRNDHEEDRFLVDVPAEQERRIAAQCESSDKDVPGWLEEELDQGQLQQLASANRLSWARTN